MHAEPSSDEVGCYDYAHPLEAVAQEPTSRREDARLLVTRRHAPGRLRAASIRDLRSLIAPGDLLVLNDTRVMQARLVARRPSGGRVTVLVLEAGERQATVLLGSRGTCLEGELLDVMGDRWRIRRALGAGRFEIEVAEGRALPQLMSEAGRMPLPPYIQRGPETDPRDDGDRERYQTVFASVEGAGAAVAAPTAGLHLTAGLLADLQSSGVRVERLRLDVGLGTFRPMRSELLDDHVMHAEHYEIGNRLAEAFEATRSAGGRVVAVGTTVVRALESAVADDGLSLRPCRGETRLFIRPGHVFRAVDALLTNFHQPRSTLLVLVSAFAGVDTVRAAYEHAIAAGYRLFSYGDAMLFDGGEAVAKPASLE